jgi:integrase
MARANAGNSTDIRLPKLCQHKGKGLAYARHQGKFIYFGALGHPESESKYRQWCAELITGGSVVTRDASQPVTVGELLAAYERDRERRGGVQSYAAIGARHLRDLYEHERADSIGPKRLKIIMAVMVAGKFRRSTINATASSIKSIFQWAVSEEMIEPGVWQALRSVAGLRNGEALKEPRKVLPVTDDVVKATLPHLPRTLQAVVQMLKLTGARPSEMLGLTPAMLDKTGDVWTATLTHHKTMRKGKTRILFFGPKAQEVLKPYLLRGTNEPCFSALEGFRQQNEVKPNHRHQPPADPKTDRRIGDSYDKDSLRRAIVRAAKKAGVDAWHPYQLRHAAATEARRVAGLDAAQVMLGHSGAAITEVYAELDKDKAVQLARMIG